MNAWLATVRRRVAAESERGSATMWMIGVVVATFLMIGLVLDGGSMLRARSDAFSIASAAARVGAQQLDPVEAVQGIAVLDPILAGRAALDYLSALGLHGSVTIEADKVTVSVDSVAQLQMLTLVGADTATFHASASARAVKATP